MTWTVVGARGFIGSAFVRRLRERGENVREMTHGEALVAVDDLGHVIYVSGVAWDAEARQDDAVRMHVDVPLALLAKRLESMVYVSSTRVYGDSRNTDERAARQIPQTDLYAATKAAGETIVLCDPRSTMRVARLSNVYGPSFRSGLMLSDFLRQAATSGRIIVRSSPDSEKDHVSVADVVDVTLRIARAGAHRVYNVAAGRNTRQGDLLAAIALASGCVVETPEGAPRIAFAPIDVDRIRGEFGVVPRDVLADMPALWRDFAEYFESGRAKFVSNS
jgi:nucleoside-diphosphate-sugar epimerase